MTISHMWCCLGQKVKHKAGHLEKGMNVLSYPAVFSFWAQLSYMLPRARFYTGTTAKVTPITVLGLPDSVTSETPRRGHWEPHLFLAATVDGKLLSLSLG